VSYTKAKDALRTFEAYFGHYVAIPNTEGQSKLYQASDIGNALIASQV